MFNMDNFLQIVSNLGFPIALVAYLLTRFEKKIDGFGTSMDRFSDIIEGKPSEGKPGLINVIQQMNNSQNKLSEKMDKLTKKIK